MTSFSRSLQTILRITLDTTYLYAINREGLCFWPKRMKPQAGDRECLPPVELKKFMRRWGKRQARDVGGLTKL